MAQRRAATLTDSLCPFCFNGYVGDCDCTIRTAEQLENVLAELAQPCACGARQCDGYSCLYDPDGWETCLADDDDTPPYGYDPFYDVICTVAD